MTTIRPFAPTDVVALDLQASQQGVLGIYEPQVSLRHGFELQAMGPAWTAEAASGRVVASAGLATIWRGRQATAWALFATDWWRHVDRKLVVRALRDGLATAGWARIEALARKAAPAEGRFLRFVGFERVAELPQWGPRSETVELYQRLGSIPDEDS